MVPRAMMPVAPSRTRLSASLAVSSRSTVFTASRRSEPSLAGVGMIANAPFKSLAKIIVPSFVLTTRPRGKALGKYYADYRTCLLDVFKLARRRRPANLSAANSAVMNRDLLFSVSVPASQINEQGKDKNHYDGRTNCGHKLLLNPLDGGILPPSVRACQMTAARNLLFAFRVPTGCVTGLRVPSSDPEP